MGQPEMGDCAARPLFFGDKSASKCEQSWAQRAWRSRREWLCTSSTSAVTLSGGVNWLMP